MSVSSPTHPLPDTATIAALAPRHLDALATEYLLGWRWATFCGVAVLMMPHTFADQTRGGLGWTPGIAAGAELDLDAQHFIDSSRTPPNRYPAVPAPTADLNVCFWAVDHLVGTVGADGCDTTGWTAWCTWATPDGVRRVEAQAKGGSPARALVLAMLEAVRAGVQLRAENEVFQRRLARA